VIKNDVSWYVLSHYFKIVTKENVNVRRSNITDLATDISLTGTDIVCCLKVIKLTLSIIVKAKYFK
jgi:hypothetical protein